MVKANDRHARLQVEQLESRELLAGNLTATFVRGQLNIEGTPNADQILVRQFNGRISIDNVAIGTSSGVTSTTMSTRRYCMNATRRSSPPRESALPTMHDAPPATMPSDAGRRAGPASRPSRNHGGRARRG